MKKILSNKYVMVALGLIVTAALFLLGQGEHTKEAVGGTILANSAIISLTAEEKAEFNEGEQKLVLAMKKYAEKMKSGVTEGLVSKADLSGILGGLKLDPASDEASTLR